jgi:hypothetical protein
MSKVKGENFHYLVTLFATSKNGALLAHAMAFGF